jgi:hypothetical protein
MDRSGNVSQTSKKKMKKHWFNSTLPSDPVFVSFDQYPKLHEYHHDVPPPRCTTTTVYHRVPPPPPPCTMLTVRAAGDAFDGRRVAADQGVGGIVGLHGFDESAAAARVADVPESNIEKKER